LKFLRAEIGIAILIGVAIFIGIIMLIIFPFPGISVSLIFTVPWMFTGMVLYISDRGGFLIRRSGDESKAALLAILGIALISESLYDGVVTLGLFIRWGGSASWEAFALAFSGLVFLFGWLLFFDQGKMAEDKMLYPPSPQRLDVETQTKYPRDLFAKYAEQYPHNPEGVLEWHIRKTMKEGKTREQAIKELTSTD
jgi:hypothetical protein